MLSKPGSKQWRTVSGWLTLIEATLDLYTIGKPEQLWYQNMIFIHHKLHSREKIHIQYKNVLVPIEDKLRLLYHFPDSDRSVVGTCSDWSLSLETVNGRHSILVTKPEGQETGEREREGGDG